MLVGTLRRFRRDSESADASATERARTATQQRVDERLARERERIQRGMARERAEKRHARLAREHQHQRALTDSIVRMIV